VAFAPDAWGWRCEGSDGLSDSLSREFYRSKVVFQSKQLDIPPAVSSRFPKGKPQTGDCFVHTHACHASSSGFFISLDVSPQLDAPFMQSPPLQAYVAALHKQRLRSSIPHVVTYIMRPVVFTSSWGVEGLGIIVVQVGRVSLSFSISGRG
jgi:hypothetical protein